MRWCSLPVAGRKGFRPVEHCTLFKNQQSASWHASDGSVAKDGERRVRQGEGGGAVGVSCGIYLLSMPSIDVGHLLYSVASAANLITV